ncbi:MULTISPECIES: hypothetical protein [Gordonia]|uniref:Phage head-tail adaptor n=1 Tax=Gordonia sihwensis NBRC 108236 TaxID=1223544 RepID=L7LF42_9ACTN|nr:MULTISPECIES: hypothetical protein [Gordonia]AUH69797.1 hypothetical protein CXX93_17685 [Gordonia sp. YC-JH1]GAC59489.1 hypothetical protein GSI01S_02_01320 [Gordonia sihwensis NBRC 108236]
MIYRDRVKVAYRIDTGEEDAHGNPIETIVEKNVLANVWPLGTEQKLDGDRQYVRTRYQMILAPTVDIPAYIGDALTITWRDYVTLYVDGSVERHYMGSKLHHYELITKAIVG